jgi:hypothetical protein
LIFGLGLGSGWQIGAKFQYASGNPYTPAIGVIQKNDSCYVVEREKKSIRYSDYHKNDICVDRQFVFESWSFSIYLDLWNLYNRENIISYSYKAYENSVLSPALRYDMGITPILSFTAKF